MRTIALLCIAFFSLGLLAEAQLSKYNRLVWQDEFNGNSLDRAKWQYEDHCSPQNQELQCYTPRTDNVYVRDGNLHVKALVENRGNKKYTSGRINTRHAAAWKYGRFEVRAKLPKGDYLWPAFWMLPRDYVYGGWAASGEIDIMEYRGQNTNQISNALHYGGAWPNNAHVGSGRINFPFDFSADYHTFTTVWERDNIYWYVDGKQVATRNLNRSWYSGRGNNPYTANRQPFDQPFFFLINMAIGGNFFGAQSQALTTAIANRWENPVMQVDWVRVYAEGAEVNPNPVPVPQNSTRAQTSQAPPKTSEAKPTVTENVRSTGISTAASSAASSAVSTAATSGATSAESSAGSTFYYSEPERSSASNEVPTPTSSEEDSNACPNGCGAGSCCDDQGLGGVCFDSNYVCASDEATGKKSLCGKGLGACNTVCYDKMMYNCVSGTLRLA